MDDHDKTPHPMMSARRKLIRGTFSVPAVLAVHNGSALAAASNKMRCATNIFGGPGHAPGPVTAPDGWKRVSRYYCNTTTGTKRYVKVADLQAVATASSCSFVGPTGTSGWVEWKSGGTYGCSTPPATPTVGSSLVAVLFDGNGPVGNELRVCGFVQEGQTTVPHKTSAITGSCWSSLMP